MGNYYTPYFSPYALLDNEQDQEDKAAYRLVNWSEKHKGIMRVMGLTNQQAKPLTIMMMSILVMSLLLMPNI
ncbi:hypothetical protein ACFIUX_09585 [Oenococcus oeni]|uniref:hypothetical protein n=1 Tax=Oenococcus oeni TaxID=1247 RepID=UPI00287BC427|nr:hypothetical protein [Oenococcus oeni]